MRRFLCACVLVVLTGLGNAQASCFTVYNKEGAMVLRTTEPPVDLSRRIGDTVPEKFGPGSTMLMVSDSSDCWPHGEGVKEVPFSGAAWAHLESVGQVDVLGGGLTGQVALPGGYSSAAYRSGGRSAALGFPYTGPRGGQFRYSASGNKVYRGRGR